MLPLVIISFENPKTMNEMTSASTFGVGHFNMHFFLVSSQLLWSMILAKQEHNRTISGLTEKSKTKIIGCSLDW